LWGHLRAKRVEGYKFRRQYDIGNYIADFCCPEMNLIIELDGGGHVQEKQKLYDLERDQYLKQKGYRVLRIWNSEVDRNMEGVLERIYQIVASPSPRPSPQKGEGDL
ncbi:MAG: endonuclease domain-containing protein, partial [bacterium]|nr:endonuclease domain-containing protein [bacterium]